MHKMRAYENVCKHKTHFRCDLYARKYIPRIMYAQDACERVKFAVAACGTQAHVCELV